MLIVVINDGFGRHGHGVVSSAGWGVDTEGCGRRGMGRGRELEAADWRLATVYLICILIGRQDYRTTKQNNEAKSMC